MTMWQEMPHEYFRAQSSELAERIAQRKTLLGSSLVILGHHYQRDEVIRFADFTGDSLKLSQLAAGQEAGRFIVFCGVHFMAESADILSAAEQAVCLPNRQAGCLMADMADEAAVAAALEELAAMTDGKIVPVTYVNSTAAVKGLTGRAGGACCTSSNVRRVFEWALKPAHAGGGGARKILSVPDEHLGRNTALAMGLPAEACAVYDPSLPNGGLTTGDVDRATVLLWKGYCYVHQIFTVQHVQGVRSEHKDIRVIVHPECPRQVVAAAHAAGSTEQIIATVADSPPGSKWAIGTEQNLVRRLASRHRDKFIRLLSDRPALCWQMGKIDLPHLLWVLDGLAEGEAVNRVSVPPKVAADARLALKRMIDIPAVGEPMN